MGRKRGREDCRVLVVKVVVEKMEVIMKVEEEVVVVKVVEERW